MSLMRHRGEVLTAEEAAEIRALSERLGEREACARLAVHRATLARAIGQLHVQRAMVTHLRTRLAALRTEAA
jgi:hypothetical protein